ncbi:hypothetical protein [Streptomyces sp. NPDC001978]|uniref:hypothetical protein n=1 Tax=Streptomyces sp. NPDC001978 TaxID=3364627 RepID=UPI0036A07657
MVGVRGLLLRASSFVRLPLGRDRRLAPVRLTVSGYLHQVRLLAADRFEGRERELAALAAFCTTPDEGVSTHGLWWRWLAPAWAGKTALMAQFVLNPPASVVVVPSLRSRTIDGVEQELYALLTVYQATRLAMTQVATIARIDPDRLSLTTALHIIRLTVITANTSGPTLLTEVLLKARTVRGSQGDPVADHAVQHRCDRDAPRQRHSGPTGRQAHRLPRRCVAGAQCALRSRHR